MGVDIGSTGGAAPVGGVPFVPDVDDLERSDLRVERDDLTVVPAVLPADVEPPVGQTASGRTWSAEVQALRALAVMLVVLFHLWPDRLTGGYIGVDVFFVISGFLITGHLLRDLDRGTFGLPRFYARRARRLLPASLLVLAVTMLGVVLLEPSTQWVQTGEQVVASATYVQNWVLAAQHVDYLNPTIAPTAVQHFWSLSVEEQFYLIWPLTLMLASGFLLRRRGARRPGKPVVIAAAMSLLLVVSLVYAIWVTRRGVEGAYFYSTARVWQFACGGLLAVAVRSPRFAQPATGRVGHLLRGALSWAGFAAIAYSGYTLTATSEVPGTAALLPVAGTLAVIAAGHVDSAWSPSYPVRFGPTQWLGNISYSLYLWHWPLLVLAPAALGVGKLGTRDKVLVLAASLLLAALSKSLVEDRLRKVGRPAVVAIATGMVLTLGLGGGAWAVTDHRAASAQSTAQTALTNGTPCFGADAILRATACTKPPFGDQVTPTPADALGALTVTSWFKGCFSMSDDDRMKSCTFGSGDAKVHIALFGDSHAMAWVPAVMVAAQQHGWRVTTFMRSSCPPNEATPKRANQHDIDNCTTWTKQSMQQIEADPTINVVLTTTFNNRTWFPTDHRSAYDTGIQGYLDTWKKLEDGGKRQVVVLKDVPRSSPSMLHCVAVSKVGGQDCRKTLASSQRVDESKHEPVPIEHAAALEPAGTVPVVDMTDGFCRAGECPAVIGNVLVYSDNSHMTPTYSHTLGAVLGRRLAAVIKV